MSVKQLSVFLENKKGSLSSIADTLAEGGVDLKAMTVADTKDYGIARIIVDDPEKALVLLTQAEQTAKIKEVLGFKVADSVGGLAKALDILEENDINVEYMYATVTSDSENAHIVARVDDNEKAEKALTQNGIELLVY